MSQPNPSAPPPSAGGRPEPTEMLTDAEKALLAEVAAEYRADHHFASVADHPAMGWRVDRDVEGHVEPIRDHLVALRTALASATARAETAEREREEMLRTVEFARGEELSALARADRMQRERDEARRKAFMRGAEWATMRYLPTGPAGFYDEADAAARSIYGPAPASSSPAASTEPILTNPTED